MDVRSVARLAAVQALYEQEHGGTTTETIDFDKRAKQIAKVNDYNRINKKIFEQIISTVSRETKNIDEKIKANLAEDWKMERIGGVLRAILRAAIGESMAPEAPPKNAIISEYIKITSRFYDNKEVKFVNAILDKAL